MELQMLMKWSNGGSTKITGKKRINSWNREWKRTSWRGCETNEQRKEVNHFRIFSILSNATSTPLIRRVTCLGKSLLSLASSPYSKVCCSCNALSSAMGRLSVILVSWIVRRDRPKMSKYESWRKACCTSRSRDTSAWRAWIHVRQAVKVDQTYPNEEGKGIYLELVLGWPVVSQVQNWYLLHPA